MTLGRQLQGLASKVREMPKYISLFTYNTDSTKAMIGKPQDRSAAAARLVKAHGGRLECFYWMLGAHDGVFIAEYPDAVSAAAASAVATGSGALKQIVTYPLFGKNDILKVLRKARAGAGAYRKPGA
jgi:uncharacterized protein with GYD domain